MNKKKPLVFFLTEFLILIENATGISFFQAKKSAFCHQPIQKVLTKLELVHF